MGNHEHGKPCRVCHSSRFTSSLQMQQLKIKPKCLAILNNSNLTQRRFLLYCSHPPHRSPLSGVHWVVYHVRQRVLCFWLSLGMFQAAMLLVGYRVWYDSVYQRLYC
uniref:Uncharacterized protein n=1 Tax=Desertifilum tharense IPPAS B-1220 TaxID=1781255 RepID=A0ACD5GXG1_9CYAN